jgi:hypothetical protein
MAAARHRVLAINPMSTSRYRQRHSTSDAKSDPGDALVLAVLAVLAGTEGHNHRLLVADSNQADAGKALAHPGTRPPSRPLRVEHLRLCSTKPLGAWSSPSSA